VPTSRLGDHPTGYVPKASVNRIHGLQDTAGRIRQQHHPASRAVTHEALHPFSFPSVAALFLTEDSAYIGGGGDIVTFSGGVVQPKSPGHWMDLGPLGTLAAGIPFALAAKFARQTMKSSVSSMTRLSA
jgi:thiamine pyrophosphate-dependent acetolactate synthase large subunit-like protein